MDRGLALRVVLYRATREAIPLFAVYALLFAEHGLSASAISALLLVWSVSAFVLEIPSGAWADLVDRRLLLIASGVVYAAAFATWLLWPTFWGFLLGFLLWSLSDATMSGTYEAYLYDQLSASGRESRYGVLRSRAQSVALVVMAVAISAAGPLHAAGGYPLVGWVSVSLAVVHVGAALLLPPAAAVAEEEPPEAEPTSVGAWLHTLRTGVWEAGGSVQVRRVLTAYAAVVALVGFDEYFPLVLADGGASVPVVAWVIAAVVLLEAVGTWFADRTARLAGLPHAALVALGGLLLAAAAWCHGPLGFVALGVGYALVSSAYVAGDVRLQHAMSGDARATVTSVAGVVAEVGFLVTLTTVGLATLRWDLSPVVAVTALVLTVPAVVAASRVQPAP